MVALSRRRFLAGASLAMIGLPAGAAALAPDERRYLVTHDYYGAIGTYVNRVRAEGEMTEIETRLDLKVRVLGITLHREEAHRTERWEGDRLVAFSGITTTNGTELAISGEARGEDFQVTTPAGSLLAPGDLRPTNPWTGRFLRSGSLLQTDSGMVTWATVSEPRPSPLTIGGSVRDLREYVIESDPVYRVWVDAQDVPIQFRVQDPSGDVTFVLAGL